MRGELMYDRTAVRSSQWLSTLVYWTALSQSAFAFSPLPLQPSPVALAYPPPFSTVFTATYFKLAYVRPCLSV